MKNSYFTSVALGISTIFSLCSYNKASAQVSAPFENKNVLFIMVDDLRPVLSAYNHPLVKTPNIDRIAQDGVLFHNAYCNSPVSGASRASLLTGLRPTSYRFNTWNARVDKQAPTAQTLNQVFHEAGYTTYSVGKVFHHQDEASNKFWTQTMKDKALIEPGGGMGFDNVNYQKKENISKLNNRNKTSPKRGPYFEVASSDEQGYIDVQIAERTIAHLREASKSNKPFFIASGFLRPHLPFVVPQKYWNIYNPAEISLPSTWYLPKEHNIPQPARSSWAGELRAYEVANFKNNQFSESEAKNMIHAYFACVSFVDAQIGKVLDELDRLNLTEKTSIVLIADHGWNLGEHGGMFCKHTQLYQSIRVPLLISTPGGLRGYETKEVVEFIDIFPTLCDLNGLDKNSALEGQSFQSVLFNKEAETKGYAVTHWQNSCTYTDGTLFYTEWWDKGDKLLHNMLFDHDYDPQDAFNLVTKPEYQQTVKELSKKLKATRGNNFY